LSGRTVEAGLPEEAALGVVAAQVQFSSQPGGSGSGKFMVPVPAEIHRDFTVRGAEEGVSVNRLVGGRLPEGR